MTSLALAWTSASLPHPLGLDLEHTRLLAVASAAATGDVVEHVWADGILAGCATVVYHVNSAGAEAAGAAELATPVNKEAGY